ncbi:MAG: hypothetical protein AAFY88_00185 [Acidobacteriota bacterium]
MSRQALRNLTRSARIRRTLTVAAIAFGTTVALSAPARAQDLEWISQHEPGSPGIVDGDAGALPPPFFAASGDGRLVVFQREIPGGAGDADVYLRDRDAGTTELISVALDGGGSDGRSIFGSLADGGRLIFFQGSADNLVADARPGVWDVFVRDRAAGETRLVSRSAEGDPADGSSFLFSHSADGRRALLYSTADNLTTPSPNPFEIYFVDLASGDVRRLTESPGGIPQGAGFQFWSAVLSADGRRVVFTAEGDGMTDEDGNGEPDLFLFDIETGETRLLSRRLDGAGSASGASGFPAITPDGRFATFVSDAPDLVPVDVNGDFDVFWIDLETGEIRLVTQDDVTGAAGGGSGFPFGPPLDDSGRFVTFFSASPLVPGDTDLLSDIYVRDTQLGRTVLASAGDPDLDDTSALVSNLAPDASRIFFIADPRGDSLPSQAYATELSDGAVRLLSQSGGVPGDGDVQGVFPISGGREALIGSEAGNLGDGGRPGIDLFIAPLPADPTAIPDASWLGRLVLISALVAAAILVLRR